jgi:hypothetical protein
MRLRVTIAGLAVASILLAACAGVPPAVSPSPVQAGPSVPAGSPAPSVTDLPSESPIPIPIPTTTPTPGPGCVVPVTVADLGGWPGSPLIENILDCFGDRDFVVTGYLAPAWGIGGTGNGVVPAWLGEWGGLDVVLWEKPRPAAGCVEDSDCLWMFLHAADPAMVRPAPERWVTLTGHFDDPLASTCRATGQRDDQVQGDAAAIATCRGHFVVTEIRTVAPPPPG